MKKDGSFESYDEAIDFIMQLSKKKAGVTEIYSNRMEYLMSQLGQPETKLKVVHITGTSGKGSVATFISSVLRSSGYDVGLHTSPHLQSMRERTQVNGKYPKVDTYLGIANRVKKAYDKTVAKGSYGKPDYFQFLTAISLYWFAKRKVDVAVIEVGAGGYGDSTNVVVPVVSVINNVGLDHTGFMGKTVEEIAMVKAGIIKKDASVVCGATQKNIVEIFEKRAKQLGSRFYNVSDIVRYKVKEMKAEYLIADISTPTYKGENVRVGLTGGHQAKNAGVAALVGKILGRRHGFKKISNETITKGLETAKIPGRFETIHKDPLVILDAAHNEDKMEALVKLAKRVFEGKKVSLVVAFKHGKDATSMLKSLSTLKVNKIYITKFPKTKSSPKRMKFDDIKQIMPRRLRKKAIYLKKYKKAINRAMDECDKNGAVLVTGSMYLIGEIRSIWEQID